MHVQKRGNSPCALMRSELERASAAGEEAGEEEGAEGGALGLPMEPRILKEWDVVAEVWVKSES